MKFQAYYTEKMQIRRWKLRLSCIAWKGSWRPAWIGLWARLGWRYVSVGLSFQKPA